jgi:hypothetical protein
MSDLKESGVIFIQICMDLQLSIWVLVDVEFHEMAVEAFNLFQQ